VSTPASNATPAALSWLGVFETTEDELAYRRAQLATETRTFLVLVVVGLAANFALVPNDFRLAPDWLGPLLVLRAINVALAVAVLAGMRRVTSPVTWDRIVSTIAIYLAVTDVAISATRPAGFSGFLAPNAVLLLAFFVLARVPLRWQVVPTAILALGHVALMSWLKPADLSTQIACVVTFVAAMVTGAEMSRRMHRHDRQQFDALRREVSLRSQLEDALAEIRTLRGIVPICAHCKSIRNDAGEWQRLEVVLHDQTHAELTHGICPTCFDRHYP
jgi:hypothetical protein